MLLPAQGLRQTVRTVVTRAAATRTTTMARVTAVKSQATTKVHNRTFFSEVDCGVIPVYMQQQGQVEFYKSMRARGVYINAPDDYLYEGGANKICGGHPLRPMHMCILECVFKTPFGWTLRFGGIFLTGVPCIGVGTLCSRRPARIGRCYRSSGCRHTISFTLKPRE